MNIATEFNEFKDTLFNKKIIRHKMRRFLGKKHKMGTYEINKISLSAFDDKRFVLDDRIHTLAYFHKDLKNRFSEMIINNKDSKSFSKMITNKNKFSIGGLIGVHVSSIVKLGCQDNLKPVYFFLRKDFERTKPQINQNQPTKTKISEQKATKATVFLRT